MNSMSYIRLLLGCLLLSVVGCSSSIDEPSSGAEETNVSKYDFATYEINSSAISLEYVGPCSMGYIQSATAEGGKMFVLRNYAYFGEVNLANFKVAHAGSLENTPREVHSNCVQSVVTDYGDTLLYVAGALRKPEIYRYAYARGGFSLLGKTTFANDYYPQSITVDGSTGLVWTLSYTLNNSVNWNALHLHCYAFNAWDLSDLRQVDSLYYVLDFLPALQDSFADGGKVFICYGLTTTARGIVVLDPLRKQQLHLSLTQLLAEEPEGLFRWGDEVYLLTISRKLYVVKGLLNYVNSVIF